MSQDVVVIIGAGGIGAAIARRQGFGRTVLLADWNAEVLAQAAASLYDASYRVETRQVDVASRASVAALADAAAALGTVVQVANTAGLSPNMAMVDRVLAVDLYGTTVVFEEFGRVIAPGGAGLVISSMAGHMAPPLPTEIEQVLARHDMASPVEDMYRAMIAASPAGRMAPPEEIAITARFLLGPDAGFITGNDLLIDGGVIAAMRAGKLANPA